MSDTASAANTAQIDYWNATGGRTWAEYQELLDRQIAPLGAEAMRVLAPQPGEKVLDVGCGCGETTLALAHKVAPDGHVTGVDISQPMLEIARRRASALPAGLISFQQADAQTADLGGGAYDAVYSRFGVMFFADPVVAFANIRKTLKPGGRLAFVCWRPFNANPWMSAPAQAAAALLPPSPPADPLAPGPFAFGDPERVKSILGGAGYQLINVDPYDQMISAGSLEDQITIALRIGPLGTVLRENPELFPKVQDVVRTAVETFQTPTGIQMPAACWIVQARNPL